MRARQPVQGKGLTHTCRKVGQEHRARGTINKHVINALRALKATSAQGGGHPGRPSEDFQDHGKSGLEASGGFEVAGTQLRELKLGLTQRSTVLGAEFVEVVDHESSQDATITLPWASSMQLMRVEENWLPQRKHMPCGSRISSVGARDIARTFNSKTPLAEGI